MATFFLVLYGLVNSPYVQSPTRGAEGVAPTRQERIHSIEIRVASLRAVNDVSGLRQIALEAKSEWLANTSDDYYPVILEICTALNSFSAHADAYFTKRDLVIAVLDSKNNIPPVLAGKLVILLQGDPEYARGELQGDRWVEERQIRIERWLKVWKLIRDQLAAMPDPGPFSLNPDPPEETGLPNGVDPSAIKDLSLRKMYKDTLEKNMRNADAYRSKRDLTDFEKRFTSRARMQLIESYLKPPFNTEQLGLLLEKYEVERTVRLAILEEVRHRVSAKTERDGHLAKSLAAMKKSEPFQAPTIGTAMNAKTLSQDPRLRIPISFTMTMPTIEDVLKVLVVATGLEITVGNYISSERVAYWSISYHNVAAWTAMEQLKISVTEDGNWIKEENGYRLIGDSKPPLEKVVKAAERPPHQDDGRSSSSRIFTVALGAFCFALILVLIRNWKRSTVSQSR